MKSYSFRDALLGFALAFLGAVSVAEAQTPARSAAPAGGLSLQDVIQAAQSQHPLVEAARARVDAAWGGRRTAGTFPNPIAAYEAENLSAPGGPAPTGLQREVSILATIPLEPLYQRGPRVRRANEDVRAAEANLTLARRLVALDAARAFYRVALAQVAADAAADIQTGIDALATYNQVRFTEGAAAEGDLIRVQVEGARVATDAVMAQIDLARARAELKPYLIGSAALADAPDSLRVAVEDAALGGVGLPPLARFVEQARLTRPDLTAARARAEAAQAETSLQRALILRQLGATIGAKRIGDVNTMVLGVSIPVPLFDRNRGEVQRASAERVGAEQELEWAERSAVAEVEAAYVAARLLSEHAARLRGTLLQRAEESRRIALAAYEEGAGSLLQVLDATRALADARNAYYRTLFTQRQSLLELNVAAGAEPSFGFDPSRPAAPASSVLSGSTGIQP